MEMPCCWAWSATKDLSSGMISGRRSSTALICAAESEPCESKLRLPKPVALELRPLELGLSVLELELNGLALPCELDPAPDPNPPKPLLSPGASRLPPCCVDCPLAPCCADGLVAPCCADRLVTSRIAASEKAARRVQRIGRKAVIGFNLSPGWDCVSQGLASLQQHREARAADASIAPPRSGNASLRPCESEDEIE